jgi:hypothetical protein
MLIELKNEQENFETISNREQLGKKNPTRIFQN